MSCFTGTTRNIQGWGGKKKRHSRWNSEYVFQDRGEICFLIAKRCWKDRRSALWVCHELWHPGRDWRCHRLHEPSCLHKLLSQPLTNEFQFLALDLMLEWFSCSPTNSTVFTNNFTLNSLQEWPFRVSRTITSPWQLPHRCLKANRHCTLIWLCLVLVIPPMNSQASQALRKELEVSSVQVHFCQEEPFLGGCRTVGYWKAEDCSSSQRAVPMKTPPVTTSWGQHPADTARGNRLASASYHLIRLAEKTSSSNDWWLLVKVAVRTSWLKPADREKQHRCTGNSYSPSCCDLVELALGPSKSNKPDHPFILFLHRQVSFRFATVWLKKKQVHTHGGACLSNLTGKYVRQAQAVF